MRILLRNWHLKLSAVLLATVLYTGLVFSGSFDDAQIQVRVEQTNQPPNAIVLSDDIGFVEVTYRAPQEMLSSVVAEAFVATIDLGDYDMARAPEPQVLDVEVNSLSDEIEVLSVEPESVRVQLDRLDQRTVPVEVDPSVPDGLEITDVELSDEQVTVRGPQSVLGQVDHALALVSIDGSGIDFDRPVDLQPVDIEGQPVGVGLLQLLPETVSVRIDVQAVEETRTVPVRPQITGDPEAGYALEALSVEPSTVTLVGLPQDLAEVTEVVTEDLGIDGATETLTFDAALVLPEGVGLADGGEPVATVTATIATSVASRTFVLGVVCENAGANACLPGIEQVAVTVSGPGNALAGLTASALTPIVDADGLEPGEHSVAPVIGGLPDGVDLLSISPGSIPITIRAPATPAPTPTPEP